METVKEQGILIVAIGHPYYGRMAHNLAVTIKTVQPDISISIAHDGKALSLLGQYDLTKVFDQQILIPTEMFTTNGVVTPFKVKLFLYDLSPYLKTLYLDADMIWLMRKPQELFDEFNGCNFTAISNGYTDCVTGAKKLLENYTSWADTTEMIAAYNMKGRLYQMRSEMLYFAKCDSIKNFFDTAKDVAENIKIKHTKIANSVADELAFNIASAVTEIYPHKEQYCPIYWFFVHHREWNDKKKLYEKYFAMSVGGNAVPPYIASLYNQIASARFNSAGIKYPYKLTAKRTWLPERKSL